MQVCRTTATHVTGAEVSNVSEHARISRERCGFSTDHPRGPPPPHSSPLESAHRTRQPHHPATITARIIRCAISNLPVSPRLRLIGQDMKRKANSATAMAQPARRQPQTSCDSCRQKKIKCDRAQPCSNCRVRGLACSVFAPAPALPPVSPAESVGHGASISAILDRLGALEQAVLKSTPPGLAMTDRNRTPLANTALASGSAREDHQTASFLDVAYDRTQSASARAGHRRLDIRVAKSYHGSVGVGSPGQGARQGPVWLVPRDEAVAMVHDFVENAYHLMPIVHIASARSVIDHVYSTLDMGHAGAIDPDHVAFILAFCAACAFFWSGAVPCQHRFETEQAAIDASLVWRTSALVALEEAQRTESRLLEGAQAYAILAYLAYNIDGPSSRFYRLHTCSVTTCRELGVHLVDRPGRESTDDAATREVKRRLWWHVTATDWMLGLNGGPLDGTYTVHPRQMKVALPRNLNDNDLSCNSDTLASPWHIATQTSSFLQAIRLAEICRTVIDAQSPDDDVADAAYNERVLGLDKLFENAIADFPPPLALDTPAPDGAPRFLCLQRASIHLGFHSRRARLHRPFLLHKDSNGQRGTKYPVSREICVRSARTVLDISMSLLEHSMLKRPSRSDCRQTLSHPQHEKCPGSPVHRLGVVINHLFWSCAILAFESSLRAGAGGNGGLNGTDADVDLDGMLIHACRLLAAAGEECTVASDIVRGMKNVYTRYRIRGATGNLATPDNGSDKFGYSAAHSTEPPVAGTSTSSEMAAPQQVQQPVGVAWPGVLPTGLDENQLISEVGLETGNSFDLEKALDDFVSTDMYDSWDQIIARLGSYGGP